MTVRRSGKLLFPFLELSKAGPSHVVRLRRPAAIVKRQSAYRPPFSRLCGSGSKPMSKAKPLLFGAALGASAMFFAQQYHVVHSHDGLQVVPRTPQLSLGLAYVDIRNWTPSQWVDRPEVARAVMAHGSGDLISESVATTLADRVTEDSSTLDELRGFLNGAKAKKSSDADDESIGFPTDDADAESGKKEGSDNDLFRIPFPQDARTKVPADPFREAKAEDKVNSAQPDSSSRSSTSTRSGSSTSSRFSSDDVLDGFEEVSDLEEDVRKPSASSGSSVTKPPKTEKSVAEQANEMWDRIAGPSSGGSSSTPKTSAPKTTPKPAPKPTESDSMFEEVTTQLENRAQEALNRAKDTAKEKALSTVEQGSATSSNYVREKAAEMLPDSAKSLLDKAANAAGSSTSSAGNTNPASILGFDPFLE